MKRNFFLASALLLGLGLPDGPALGARPPASHQATRPSDKAPKLARKAKRTRGRKAKVVRERPVATYTRAGLPNIQAQAAVVVDLKDNTPLFQKNPDAVRPIASISKLMAMMVVLDRRVDLDGATMVTDDDRRLALRGARSRLPVGTTFTNRDLLYAALMASDNRAVPALGRAVGLSPEQLSLAMTQKAREMGLKVTTFHDPTGLDHRNVSTPNEVAQMLKAALRYPMISQIGQTATYVAKALPAPKSRPYQVEYANTDLLVRGSRHKVLGGKTGYNDQAGYCLAVAARLPDKSGAQREVAMVFLGEYGKLTRFADFTRAAQWLQERGAPTMRTGSLGSRRDASPLGLTPQAADPARRDALTVAPGTIKAL